MAVSSASKGAAPSARTRATSLSSAPAGTGAIGSAVSTISGATARARLARRVRSLPACPEEGLRRRATVLLVFTGAATGLSWPGTSPAPGVIPCAGCGAPGARPSPANDGLYDALRARRRLFAPGLTGANLAGSNLPQGSNEFLVVRLDQGRRSFEQHFSPARRHRNQQEPVVDRLKAVLYGYPCHSLSLTAAIGRVNLRGPRSLRARRSRKLLPQSELPAWRAHGRCVPGSDLRGGQAMR